MTKVTIGAVFGRLTVLRLVPDKKNPKAECMCACGVVATPQRGALVNGRAKSCGCLRTEQNSTAGKTHGMSKAREYKAFFAMLGRCNDPKNPHYKNYGGRGIKVLYETFEEFFADVGVRPHGSWIDRRDNDLGYQTGNCRWVTPTKSQENKRNSKTWTINGTTYESSVIAAKALGVTSSVVIRGCDGYMRRGRYIPPREGWSSELKYPLTPSHT